MVSNRRQASYLTKTRCSLHFKVMLVKLKTVQPECSSFQIVFVTRIAIQFILQHALQVNIARSLRIRRRFVGVIPVQ